MFFNYKNDDLLDQILFNIKNQGIANVISS